MAAGLIIMSIQNSSNEKEKEELKTVQGHDKEKDDSWLSPVARNVFAVAAGFVVLALIVIDTLDKWLCNCEISIGPLGLMLGAAVFMLFLNFRLSDWRGKD
jgi:hypothetical protein